MQLITSLRHITQEHKNCVVTIGNYDGVHLGHQEILRQVTDQSKKNNTKSLVIIFEPQPKEYFLPPQQRPARITHLNDKVYLLGKSNIDYVLCLKFNTQLQKMSATEFSQNILINTLAIHSLFLGEDFCCGNKREGTPRFMSQLLSQYSIPTTIVQSVNLDGKKISSTLIRQYLKQGELLTAKTLLGRNFFMSGKVVRGQGIGKKWGTATANINLHNSNLVTTGIFVVTVSSEVAKLNNAKGVASIGYRPSVADNRACLEVHIFGYDINLYDIHIEVTLLKKLRDEAKFVDISLLQQQIEQDKLDALKYFTQE